MNQIDVSTVRDAIADAVGLSRRPPLASELAPAFGILAAGFVLGAAAALLLAPTNGRELRSEIGKKVDHLRRRAGEEEPPILREM